MRTHNATYGLPESVIVPPADAERMIASYAPRAGYVIRDGDTLPNTRSTTFELGLLEALLAEVRNQGAERVTIHLATCDADYPDTARFMPESRYWGYNTVLLAPEGGGSATVDIGIFSGGGGKPVVNKGELKPLFEFAQPDCGPVLLARDGQLGELPLASTIRPAAYKSHHQWLLFTARFLPESYTEYGADPITVDLCDYATAGYGGNGAAFQVWLPVLQDPRRR